MYFLFNVKVNMYRAQEKQEEILSAFNVKEKLQPNEKLEPGMSVATICKANSV
jgi:hypothetical protein